MSNEYNQVSTRSGPTTAVPQNSMRINAAKCYVMTIGRGKTISYMYELWGTFLQGVCYPGKIFGGAYLQLPRYLSRATQTT